MDMSTPLLLEVVPETDANPVSFYSGGGRFGVGHGLELDSPFAASLGHQKLKGFQCQEALAP